MNTVRHSISNLQFLGYLEKQNHVTLVSVPLVYLTPHDSVTIQTIPGLTSENICSDVFLEIKNFKRI